MKMQEIRAMAKQLGINSFGKTKKDLIHQIQRAEGNYACFDTAGDYCDQINCCFRTICLNEKKNPNIRQNRRQKEVSGQRRKT